MSDIKNQHEQSGEIVFIGPVESITANFSKRIVAIQVTNGNRNEFIPFEFGNPSDVLNSFTVGNKVHITYKLRGNRHKTDHTKFFAFNEATNMTKL